MFCKRCGKQIPDDAKTCMYCNEPVTNTVHERHVRKPYNEHCKPVPLKTWALFLICFIPVIGPIICIIILLVWAFRDPSTNRYPCKINFARAYFITLLISLPLFFVVTGFASAIALPIYQRYAQEKQIEQDVNTVNDIRSNVELCLLSEGLNSNKCSNSLSGKNWSIPGSAFYGMGFRNIKVTNGVIEITSNHYSWLKGQNLTLTPVKVTTSEVQWEASGTCVSSGLCAKMLPFNMKKTFFK